MFIVSTFELFDERKISNCDGITSMYFVVSLFYLVYLAMWTINLFRFYKMSANLRLHTLTTYFLCLKVRIFKNNIYIYFNCLTI